MENTVQELANIQSQCQELIDRIREIEKEIEQTNKPEFERVPKNEEYFMVDFANGKAIADNIREAYDDVDDARYNNNNYFKTAERAEEVTDKINFLLQLERLHDTFCSDYVPDWNWNSIDQSKYYVLYSNRRKMFVFDTTYSVENKCMVYFPSEEIAQKVCDILNNELEDNNYEN